MADEQKDRFLGMQLQRGEVTLLTAGLKLRWVLPCTGYTSCSMGCFPKSNWSTCIFLKALTCTLAGICVLFHSGYGRSTLLNRSFPGSEL